MAARSIATARDSALFGLEGELVNLQISVEPRLLEDLLDTLAELDFPLNPQLYHLPSSVLVEFPAYSTRVDQVRETLDRRGFSRSALDVQPSVAAVRSIS